MWAGPTPGKIKNNLLTPIFINIISYILTKEKAWKK